jgi:hypothetical protein
MEQSLLPALNDYQPAKLTINNHRIQLLAPVEF